MLSGWLHGGRPGSLRAQEARDRDSVSLSWLRARLTPEIFPLGAFLPKLGRASSQQPAAGHTGLGTGCAPREVLHSLLAPSPPLDRPPAAPSHLVPPGGRSLCTGVSGINEMAAHLLVLGQSCYVCLSVCPGCQQKLERTRRASVKDRCLNLGRTSRRAVLESFFRALLSGWELQMPSSTRNVTGNREARSSLPLVPGQSQRPL